MVSQPSLSSGNSWQDNHNQRYNGALVIRKQSIRNVFRKVGFSYEELIESIEFTHGVIENDLIRDHRILESVLHSMFGMHADMILRLIDEEVLRLSDISRANTTNIE
jgi:hypothetical protein